MAACRGLDVLLGAPAGRASALLPAAPDRRRAHLPRHRAVARRGARRPTGAAAAAPRHRPARRRVAPRPPRAPRRRPARPPVGRRPLAGATLDRCGRAQARAAAEPRRPATVRAAVGAGIHGLSRCRRALTARAGAPPGAGRRRSSPPRRPARPRRAAPGAVVADMSTGLRFGYGTNGFANHRLDDALGVIADLGYDGRRADPRPPTSTRSPPTWPAQPPRPAAGSRARARASSSRPAPGTCSTRGASTRPTLLTTTREPRARLPAPRRRRRRRPGRRGGLVLVRASARRRVAGRRPGTASSAAAPSSSTHAAAAGVTLGFEPEPGMLVETIADVLERLRAELGDPAALGLTLDIGHCRCLRAGRRRRLRAPRPAAPGQRADRRHAPRRARAPRVRRGRDRLPGGAARRCRGRLPRPGRRRAAPALARRARRRRPVAAASCARPRPHGAGDRAATTTASASDADRRAIRGRMTALGPTAAADQAPAGRAATGPPATRPRAPRASAAPPARRGRPGDDAARAAARRRRRPRSLALTAATRRGRRRSRDALPLRRRRRAARPCCAALHACCPVGADAGAALLRRRAAHQRHPAGRRRARPVRRAHLDDAALAAGRAQVRLHGRPARRAVDRLDERADAELPHARRRSPTSARRGRAGDDRRADAARPRSTGLTA